ncbi:MAG: right-handed parallel beta-helix repeat-containing protein [Thermoplasmata archaeon]|nr:MAG: right-handed parallel beta-helix repeat-containing protein [Thermoplasmata archaeon]
MRRIMAVFAVLVVFTGVLVVSDLYFDTVTMNTQAATVYVGGTGPGNNTTIQEGIAAANPGDTVYVYAGTYEENLVIDKTITLTGEDKDTTLINATGNINGVLVSNADYVNVTGFTIKKANAYNLKLTSSDNSHIFDNILQNSGSSALGVFSGYDNLIEDNQITNNTQGLLISDHSNSNVIRDNTITSCGDRAISIQGQSTDNLILNNEISVYNLGIYVYESEDNHVENNQISNGVEGIRVLVVNSILIQDNIISNNVYNLRFYSASASIMNCTLQNPISYDVWVDDPDSVGPQVIFHNTTFDENKVKITGSGSSFLAYFRIQVKVVDEEDKGASGISVVIKDNHGATGTKPYTTDSEGIIGPLDLFGFLETETQRNYSTPYNISAFGINLLGWASPEVEFNTGPVITVMVYLDSDGDDVFDKDDDFPSDATQWDDSDGDGYGDNATGNNPDIFPNDPTEWADSDNDSIGDNGDSFPDDPNESSDGDGDGIGDNSDDFPEDPAASMDSDGDDRPDKWNTGKSKSDSTTGLELDEFPDDPDEWRDSDGDGVGDNSDFLPSLNNNLFILIVIVIIIIIIILVILVRKKGKRPVMPEKKKEEGKSKKERPPPPPWVKTKESAEKKEMEEDEEEDEEDEDELEEEEEEEDKDEEG